MNRVFHRLGFITVEPEFFDRDWDVLWMVESPFDHPFLDVYHKITPELDSQQRINHFPGNDILFSKLFESSFNRQNEFVLPRFRFPENDEDFQRFVKEYPTVSFLEKTASNQVVKLVNASDISQEKSGNYYQVYMDDPFIIDGRAVQLSTFFVITSIEPLRIYRYTQEILVNFATEPYHPFDPLKADKYVANSSITDMPSLGHFTEKLGFSFKDSFEAYLVSKNQNVTKLWQQIDEAIVKLVFACESSIMDDVS